MNNSKLNEELGILGKPNLVSQLCKEISSSWKSRPFEKPFMLMISGFQGSGKTTVIHTLQKNNEFVIISPDQIRHKLFARGLKFSDEFVHTVNATRNKLLEIALSKKFNIIVDQFMDPDRAYVIGKIVKVKKVYRIIKVFLFANMETLSQRVKDRKTLPQTYKGTFKELQATMEMYDEPDLSIYDKVLDSAKLGAKQVAAEVEKLL